MIVFFVNYFTLHRQICRFHTIGIGREVDIACIHRTSYQHTVDAALYWQRHSTDKIVVSSCGDTAYPLSFTIEFEMNHAIVQRTTSALFVNDFHLEEHHIGTIGFSTFWILDSCESQLIRLTNSLELVVATVGAYGFEHTGLKGNTIEGK